MIATQHAYRDNLIRHAKVYIQHGLALTPIRPRDKRPYLREWGRHPIRTVEQITQHWRSHPADNVGIILGPLSGICDLEYDSPRAGAILDRVLTDEEKHTPTYESGKSLHRLYRLPKHTARLGNVLAADDVELRLGLDGQSQSVAPPSIHPTGRIYGWLRGLGIWQAPLQPCPESVIYHLQERLAIQEEAKGAPVSERSAVIPLSQGDRPGDLFNTTATWDDVLTPHGWRIVGHKGDLTLWQHPGSQSGSTHCAATGWITAAGNDVLIVYSNRTPFRSVLAERVSYTKFQAFAVLNCNGNPQVAAKALADRGFTKSHGPTTMEAYAVP